MAHAAKKRRPDILTANLGTIWTFTSTTLKGSHWLSRHIRPRVCEARYGTDICVGALNAGLVLQDAHTGRVATEVPSGF